MFINSKYRILHIITIILRAFAVFVGIFAFISVVIIALHATGYRPYTSITLFGYELQLAVTEKNIAISLVNSFAYVSQWNLPIEVFDKWSAVMASIGAGISYFASKLTSRYAKTASEKSFFGRESLSIASHFRQQLLKAIENTYVEGQLKHSLFDAAKVELGMVAQQDVVEGGEYPWKLILHQPGQAWQALPPDTRTIDVLDVLGGAMLILGAPGSGKTTTLLDLAKDLLARARTNPTTPIPVILNLPTWITKREPFAQWLVDQLRNSPYEVPKKYAQAWIENDKLLLLLDGLDEISDIPTRTACVEAINTFRREHATDIVVCCRTNDYKVLQSRLQLRGAIEIQPLTLQQVDKYLLRAGKKFPALRDLRRVLLHSDSLRELRELMRTPVVLNIVCLTFAHKPIAEIRITGLGKQLYKQLFDSYVQSMLERRGTTEYSEEQIRHWLAKLAQQRQPYGQATFFIEQMQPDWLPSRVHRLLWQSILGLGVGSLCGLLGGVGYWRNYSFSYWEQYYSMKFYSIEYMLLFGFLGGLVGGLVGGVAGWLMGLRGSIDEIRSTEVLQFDYWKIVVFSVAAVLTGMLVLVRELVFGLADGREVWFTGLGLFLGIGLLLGVFEGHQVSEAKTKTVPNQGVWRSLRNAVVLMLVGAMVGVLIVGLDFGLMAVRSNLLLVLCFMILFGVVGGIDVFIKHFILRFLLYWNNYLPWRYVRFLDYAANCILLQRVGGGYAFIHGLLLDYFAELEISSRDSLNMNAPSEVPTNID